MNPSNIKNIRKPLLIRNSNKLCENYSLCFNNVSEQNHEICSKCCIINKKSTEYKYHLKKTFKLNCKECNNIIYDSNSNLCYDCVTKLSYI